MYICTSSCFSVFQYASIDINVYTSLILLQERSKILFRIADLIEKHNDEIATLETWDSGKLYQQVATIEIPMIVRLLRYYAGKLVSEFRTSVILLYVYILK